MREWNAPVPDKYVRRAANAMFLTSTAMQTTLLRYKISVTPLQSGGICSLTKAGTAPAALALLIDNRWGLCVADGRAFVA